MNGAGEKKVVGYARCSSTGVGGGQELSHFGGQN
jgi:hypothetical protein